MAKITPCFENGKSTVFRNLTGGIGSGTTELHIARPLLVNPDYVLIFFKSPHFIETGISRMTGTAGQKRVPTEYFAYTHFPLPPLAEQHRIVAKVDELIALCDRLQAARAEREAARDRLTKASLSRLNNPDPDPAIFADQARFALRNLQSLAVRSDQIKHLRHTILNLAVRGKLVPQDPGDEPAMAWLNRTFNGQGDSTKGKSKRETVTPLDAINAGYSLPETWFWMSLGNLVTGMDADWSPQCENHPRSDDSKWGVLKTTAVQSLAFDWRQHKELPSKFSAPPLTYRGAEPYRSQGR